MRKRIIKEIIEVLADDDFDAMVIAFDAKESDFLPIDIDSEYTIEQIKDFD